MRISTAQLGTHLAKNSDIMRFEGLHKTKLDELPQLLNVIKGDMSLVGPRPGLTTQVELKNEQKVRNVSSHEPGITVLAQVSEVDISTLKALSRYDAPML